MTIESLGIPTITLHREDREAIRAWCEDGGALRLDGSGRGWRVRHHEDAATMEEAFDVNWIDETFDALDHVGARYSVLVALRDEWEADR